MLKPGNRPPRRAKCDLQVSVTVRPRRPPPSNINLLDARARAGHAHVYVHVDRESRNSKRGDFESGGFLLSALRMEKEALRNENATDTDSEGTEAFHSSTGKEEYLSCLRCWFES